VAKAAAQTKWLTPGVGGIGAASLLSDLGHEVPTALLPRFILSLGGSAATLGIIEGIADGLAGISRLFGGALADDPSRRRAGKMIGDRAPVAAGGRRLGDLVRDVHRAASLRGLEHALRVLLHVRRDPELGADVAKLDLIPRAVEQASPAEGST
jgi:hypothetical protein